MITNFYQPPIDDIRKISWTGDSLEYDRELFKLGLGKNQFLIINPYTDTSELIHYIKEFPSTDKCVVWHYNNEWIAKLFSNSWQYKESYTEIEITKPQMLWKKNPELDKLMKFDNDPFGSFEPPPWDSGYQHIWYIDPKFNPLQDKVWAISCQPIGQKISGVKDMGYLSPSVQVEFNEHLPKLAIDLDNCYPPFWDIAHECAYELDPVHQTDQRLWVIKISPTYRKPKEWKWLGIISPEFNIEYNKDLPRLEYDLDYVIPWHDLGYEHIWLLDKKHLQNNEEDIWAIKIKVSKDIVGSKIIDYVSPNINVIHNKDLPRVNYELDYIIPWHDLGYEHIWMLDKKYVSDINDDIWAIKMIAVENSTGIKEVGKVLPIITDQLDVIFISYHEPNAEENWQRVLEKAPWAKRVDGVKGIFEAHKAAAKLVNTDMFYVVDGDAWLADEWNFDYQPGFFDRDCTYIWRAKNPINDLIYGYGGVKLFPTAVVNNATEWKTLDLSTTITSKIKIMDTLSNITAFDTDEKSVWRSTFRECVKLCYNVLQNCRDATSQSRLQNWLFNNSTHIFKKTSADAAQYAVEWATNNRNSPDEMKLINNRQWLEEEFNKYESRK